MSDTADHPWAEFYRAEEAEDPQPRQRANGRDAEDWKSEPWDHPLDPWHRMDLPRLQGIVIPKRRFIAPSWVPVHETTGLGGAGGDGKTLLAQMLVTAGALGRADPLLAIA
jgi:hypothetical protein